MWTFIPTPLIGVGCIHPFVLRKFMSTVVCKPFGGISKFTLLVYLATKMNWLDFEVKRSKTKVTVINDQKSTLGQFWRHRILKDDSYISNWVVCVVDGPVTSGRIRSRGQGHYQTKYGHKDGAMYINSPRLPARGRNWHSCINVFANDKFFVFKFIINAYYEFVLWLLALAHQLAVKAQCKNIKYATVSISLYHSFYHLSLYRPMLNSS